MFFQRSRCTLGFLLLLLTSISSQPLNLSSTQKNNRLFKSRSNKETNFNDKYLDDSTNNCLSQCNNAFSPQSITVIGGTTTTKRIQEISTSLKNVLSSKKNIFTFFIYKYYLFFIRFSRKFIH